MEEMDSGNEKESEEKKMVVGEKNGDEIEEKKMVVGEKNGDEKKMVGEKNGDEKKMVGEKDGDEKKMVGEKNGDENKEGANRKGEAPPFPPLPPMPPPPPIPPPADVAPPPSAVPTPPPPVQPTKKLSELVKPPVKASGRPKEKKMPKPPYPPPPAPAAKLIKAHPKPKWRSNEWERIIKVDDDEQTDDAWGAWKGDDTKIDKSWTMPSWGHGGWGTHGWHDHAVNPGWGAADAGGWGPGAGSSTDGQQWQHAMMTAEGQGWSKILSLSSSIHSNLLLVVLLDTSQSKIQFSILLSSRKVLFLHQWPLGNNQLHNV